jgi:hypothetical protein
MRRSAKVALATPLALIGLATAPHARADSIPAPTILLGQTTLVVGTQATVDSFNTPGAGTVTVSLANLAWPAPLSALSFSATSANQVLWSTGGSAMETGGGSFQVNSGGTYFAHIMATTSGSGPWGNYGLYSLLMTFTPGNSPVPLPAAGWLLLTGMFVLAGLARAARPFELLGTAKA